MSCPFHDVKGFLVLKFPPMASQLRRGQITNHKTINIYILCCRLSMNACKIKLHRKQEF